MQRIALVCYHTSPLAELGSSSAGGMNVYVRRLVEGLGRRGLDVDVFTRADSPGQPLVQSVEAHVRLVSLPAGPPVTLSKRELASYVLPFGEAMATFSRDQGLTYDVIHSHYWLSGLAALSLRESGQPLIHMFHTLSRVKCAYQPDSGTDDAPCREHAELRLLRGSDALVFATEAEVADVRRLYDVAPAHVALIPPGVDQERFAPANQRHARDLLGLQGKRVVLFVGRMDRAKGIDKLLDAVARLRTSPSLFRDLCVVIVGGDGGQRDAVAVREAARLRDLVGVLGLRDRVSFRGVVPQDQLPLYYAAADICAVPSAYESFGMVAVEAMACARPVVGFHSPGLAQTVDHERTGLLVGRGDVDGFASALATLLSDPLLGRRFGLRARASVRRFTWDAVVESTDRLYRAATACPSLAVAR